MKAGEFFSALFEARLGFGDIRSFLGQMLSEVREAGGVAPVIEGFFSLFEGGTELMPTLLFIVSLFVCMFGGRIFPLFRVAAFFALGYLVGVCCIARGSASELAIGLAVAIIFAILSRPLYLVAYPSVFALMFYVFVGNTLGWGIAPAIVAAVCAALLALVMRGSAEIVISAILGAWGICESAAFIRNFVAGCQNPQLVTAALMLTVAFVGTLVQFGTKQRAL